MTAKTTDFSGLLYYNPAAHGFNPVASATITGPDNIDEGAELTWNLVTWNIPDSDIYWKIIPSGDNLNAGRFTYGLSGTMPVVNHRTFISVAVSADSTTSITGQSFDIQFSTTLNGTPFATKYGVGVNDTSQTVTPSTSFDFYAGGAQNALGHDDWWLAPSGWWKYGELVGNPAHTLITYPDSSNEKVWVFTGAEQLISPDLSSYPGTFTGNAITIQMWFYPTADNVVLLSETGQGGYQNGAGWHYSVFDLYSGTVRARLWDGATLYATSVYTANAWNHVYLTADSAGNMSFELNGIPSGDHPQYLRQKPTGGVEYFVVGFADQTSNQDGHTAGAFQGYLGQINIADGPVPSNFNNEKAKHGL